MPRNLATVPSSWHDHVMVVMTSQPVSTLILCHKAKLDADASKLNEYIGTSLVFQGLDQQLFLLVDAILQKTN